MTLLYTASTAEMRFHVLGICHTVSSEEFLSCAFTQKVVVFCHMMARSNKGHKRQKRRMTPSELVRHKTIHYVIHYGHERSKVPCDEHVTVMTDDILRQTYGDYDWKRESSNEAGDFADNPLC